jgi:hypothetical protein
MVKRPAFSFLPLIFLCTHAFADEYTNDVYLYFHPFTLPVNPFVLGSMLYEDRPLTVYLTLEYSLNEYFSIPVTPSLWFKYGDYYRLGSGAGIRFNYKYSELYFQLMPAHYLKRSLSANSDTNEKTSERFTDLRFYVGFGGRGAFFDIGIGGSSNHRGLSVDANCAMGFKIL